jgi:hypothetical protein
MKSRGKIQIKGKGEMRTYWINEGRVEEGVCPTSTVSKIFDPPIVDSKRRLMVDIVEALLR